MFYDLCLGDLGLLTFNTGHEASVVDDKASVLAGSDLLALVLSLTFEDDFAAFDRLDSDAERHLHSDRCRGVVVDGDGRANAALALLQVAVKQLLANRLEDASNVRGRQDGGETAAVLGGSVLLRHTDARLTLLANLNTLCHLS